VRQNARSTRHSSTGEPSWFTAREEGYGVKIRRFI